jgi:hypothetical protein
MRSVDILVIIIISILVFVLLSHGAFMKTTLNVVFVQNVVVILVWRRSLDLFLRASGTVRKRFRTGKIIFFLSIYLKKEKEKFGRLWLIGNTNGEKYILQKIKLPSLFQCLQTFQRTSTYVFASFSFKNPHSSS